MHDLRTVIEDYVRAHPGCKKGSVKHAIVQGLGIPPEAFETAWVYATSFRVNHPPPCMIYYHYPTGGTRGTTIGTSTCTPA